MSAADVRNSCRRIGVDSKLYPNVWPQPLTFLFEKWDFSYTHEGEHLHWLKFLRPSVPERDGQTEGQIDARQCSIIKDSCKIIFPPASTGSLIYPSAIIFWRTYACVFHVFIVAECRQFQNRNALIKLCGRSPQYAHTPASWPLTFCPWKCCPNHVWRGLPLCQF